MSSAEYYPPGDLLREELAERGWSVEEFSQKSSLSDGQVQSILDGARITEITALAIGQALGTSPELWMNLQRLHDEDLANGEQRSVAS